MFANGSVTIPVMATSLCGSSFFQIKDILKGALRFNQSQLEAEENEEITIADDHYTSTAAAETALSTTNHLSVNQPGGETRQSRDSHLDGSENEREEEPVRTPPEPQVGSSLLEMLKEGTTIQRSFHAGLVLNCIS